MSTTESKHITKVLRKKIGSEIALTDGGGTFIKAKIIENHTPQTKVQIINFKKMPFPSENRITVGLSVIRPNRLDWAVEKLTELGVKRIVPLLCHYSVIHSIKLEHLKKVLQSALKQSSQFHLPKISEPVPFDQWISEIDFNKGNKFIATPREKLTFKDRMNIFNDDETFIIIGPEGGFHREEIKKALQYNFWPVKISSSILRTETAAIVAIDRLKLIKELVLSQ